ncbi:MAG: hypothetical protein LBH30_07685 [Prevotellaceae bacterium]|nr:hypothetical protein [Prevotellaceae bacterium]
MNFDLQSALRHCEAERRSNRSAAEFGVSQSITLIIIHWIASSLRGSQ